MEFNRNVADSPETSTSTSPLTSLAGNPRGALSILQANTLPAFMVIIRTMLSTIDTTGDDVFGISGQQSGDGNLTITLQQGSEIDTIGRAAHAVHSLHRGDGEAEINIEAGVDIHTTGEGAAGVFLNNANKDAGVMRNAVVTVNGSIINWSRFSLSREVSVGGLDSQDREYTGLLNFEMRF